MFISISFESQGLKNVPLLSALTASSMNLSISSMRHSMPSLQSSQASCKAFMALIMPLGAPLFVCEAMYSGRILHTRPLCILLLLYPLLHLFQLLPLVHNLRTHKAHTYHRTLL